MLLQETQHLRPARELFEEHRIAPGGIDLEGGVHHVDVPLKSDLVVSSACGTMGQHSAAVLLHGLQQTPGSHISSDAGGLPVAPVVHRLSCHRLKGSLGNLLLEIHHDGFNTTGSHLFDHVIHVFFIWLSDVCGEALHLDAGQAKAQGHGLGVQAAADADAHHVAVLHILLQNGRLLQAIRCHGVRGCRAPFPCDPNQKT
mmetsp:Transcript_70271/g.115438  ORF Transcript_70271/g.115438 Transcript_70271/m.115438 type:complete len:200 (+) Transcript_70271:911-1510(+)